MDSFSAFIDTTFHDGLGGGSRASFLDLDDLPIDATDLFDELAGGKWNCSHLEARHAHSSRMQQQKQPTWQVRLQHSN